MCTTQLMISLVISKLDYCNCLFNNMSSENFHRIQLVQNHAARMIKKAPKTASATSILKELHWLPIKQRVSYEIAFIVFKCLYIENFTSYLKDIITIYKPPRSLRSAGQILLNKPFKKLSTFGQMCFHFAAPEVWNSLPFELRCCESLPVLKSNLKTHFFKILIP